MKVTALAFVATWFSPAFSFANSESEEAVYSVFSAIVEARFDHDFDRLAGLIDPASLKLWRKIVNVEYERLVEQTSMTDVQSIIGLESSPLDSELSDAALFETLASRALELDPGFVGAEEMLPYEVHGLIVDDQGKAWLTYDFEYTHRSKRSSVKTRSPRVHTFHRVNWCWKLHTTMLTGEISAVWRDALKRRLRRPSNRESISLPLSAGNRG